MIKRIAQSLTIFLVTMLMIPGNIEPSTKSAIPEVGIVETAYEMPTYTSSNHTIEVKTIEPPKPKVSDYELDLLALVTMAEAEGESELGKRLVISTVLNRVDSDDFPDTISDVIWQPNQFTSMWNGRADRCKVTDEIRQLVREEMESRTNSKVLYFHANEYGNYGTPMFQVENHYFSS